MQELVIDFLSAKVHPQRVVGGLLDRESILSEFRHSGPHPKLSLLVAPAGYGKSTLLKQLTERRKEDGEIVSWLSLDENDSNLLVFSNYLLYGFSVSVEPEQTNSFALLFNESCNANPKEKLTLLFKEIEKQNKAATIILDDFHLVNSTKLQDFVDWIIVSMPLNLSLVIGSRTELQLKCISNLRAKSNLIEINGLDLKFTLEECYAFCSSGVGEENHQKLPPALVKQLYGKTEGWVAAMQMAMLAIRNHEKPEQFVREFSGIDRDIVNFLADCVLSGLEVETRNFLIETSILDRINGELAVLITGQKSAPEKLLELEKAGLFLFAIDRSNRWFRYHHLFRDYLRSQLREADEVLYAALACRAGSWFADSGRIDEAIGYYLKAKEFDLASKLIAQRASTLVQYQGQHETLFSWLKHLPKSNIIANPEILIPYLWSLTFTRCFKEVAPLLDLNEIDTYKRAAGADTEASTVLELSLEMLNSMKDCMSGRQLSARENSKAWLGKWRDAPQFERGSVLGILGASCLHSMELKLAKRSVGEARAEFHKCGADYGVAWMDTIYALACEHQGLISEAKEVLEMSLEHSNRVMGEFSFASAMLSLGLGSIYYSINRLQIAEELIDKGFLYIEDHGLPDATISAYITKSKLLMERDDVDGALDLLLVGQRFGEEQDIQNFSFALGLERARILISKGKVDSAEAILGDYFDVTLEQPLNTLSEYERILLGLFRVRLAIARGSYSTAANMAAQLSNETKIHDYVSITIQCLILQASALSKHSQTRKALRVFEKAVSLAAVEGQARLFVDEAEHSRALFFEFSKSYKVKNTGCDESTFVSMLEAGLTLQTPSSEIEVENPVEQANDEKPFEGLTKRELQILGLLNQGLSNQQLADALFISLATTKWHLSNIYSKLGVKNKVQAIKASRQMNNTDSQ